MTELTGLQKFARELLTASFEGCTFDGDDIQQLALKHDLVRVESYDPEVHILAAGCDILNIGDDIYCFNKIIEKSKRSSSTVANNATVQYRSVLNV